LNISKESICEKQNFRDLYFKFNIQVQSSDEILFAKLQKSEL